MKEIDIAFKSKIHKNINSNDGIFEVHGYTTKKDIQFKTKVENNFYLFHNVPLLIVCEPSFYFNTLSDLNYDCAFDFIQSSIDFEKNCIFPFGNRETNEISIKFNLSKLASLWSKPEIINHIKVKYSDDGSVVEALNLYVPLYVIKGYKKYDIFMDNITIINGKIYSTYIDEVFKNSKKPNSINSYLNIRKNLYIKNIKQLFPELDLTLNDETTFEELKESMDIIKMIME